MNYLIAQKRVHDWISTTKLGYFPPFSMLSALIEESGEVAKAIEKNDLEEIRKEISDLVFPIICLANSHKLKLNAVKLETNTTMPYTRLQQYIGEIAREINHVYGPKKKKLSEKTQSLEYNLNQSMACVEELAKKYEIKIDEGFEKLMKKFDTRDKDRWEKK
jgi:NTP pyrophosphatase (non-canonical NTP hydrolase)